jgi:Tol biopolymer transport system component
VTKTKGNYRYPLFLPDGRRFLYVALAAQAESGVYLNSLDASENRRVLADASSVAFAAGRLLFVRENTLMAMPFDAKSGEASGDVVPIAEDVAVSNTGYEPITAAENGVLLYQSGGTGGSNQIVWYDPAGKLLGPASAPGTVRTPSISPDEKMIAFTQGPTPPTSDIWLRDLARGTNTRFTFDALGNFEPFWSPKGDRIVFASSRGNKNQNLYQKPVSGSSQDELLLSTRYAKVPDQWSRDGRFIVYSELDPKTGWDLWVLPVGALSGPGSGKPIAFLQTEFNESHGQLSPDSRWMAYSSDESGQREVYTRPFPASDGKWRVSTAGGDQPRWRGDGKELFFAGADGKMMAVAVKAVAEPKPSFETGAPVPLFESHIVESGAFLPFQYDVTADGKRFLVTATAAGASALPLTVVVNWSAGLKK